MKKSLFIFGFVFSGLLSGCASLDDCPFLDDGWPASMIRVPTCHNTDGVQACCYANVQVLWDPSQISLSKQQGGTVQVQLSRELLTGLKGDQERYNEGITFRIVQMDDMGVNVIAQTRDFLPTSEQQLDYGKWKFNVSPSDLSTFKSGSARLDITIASNTNRKYEREIKASYSISITD